MFRNDRRTGKLQRTVKPWQAWVGVAVVTATLLLPKRAAATTCLPFPPYVTDADRIGINVVTDYGKGAADYDQAQLHGGWYLDYRPMPTTSARLAGPVVGASVTNPAAINFTYAPLKNQGVMSTAAAQGLAYAGVFRTADVDDGNWQNLVGMAVTGNPAGLWLIGNEPDRHLQDGRTPAQYAQIYHDVYTFIKSMDPEAKVAIAGMVQPTPLRLRYLDMVLDEYLARYGTKLPVDMFNIHGFILREDDTWGAGVPQGLEAYASLGRLYEVPDHGNLAIFKQQIIDFRRWMAERGYRDTPLVVSEYGILMAPDYDAGGGRVYDSEFVTEFMLGTFEFFMSARDDKTGYPSDDNRLVQAWAWYSLNDYIYHSPDRENGFNGNLLDHDSGVMTPVGQAFAAYAGQLYQPYTDAALRSMEVASATTKKNGQQVTVDVTVINRGNQPAEEAKVELWLGDPQAGGTLIAEKPLPATLAPRCSERGEVTFEWQPGDLPAGFYELTVRVVAGDATLEAGLDNNRLTRSVRVGPDDEFEWVYLPMFER